MVSFKKLIILKKNSDKEKKEYSLKNLGKFYFFFLKKKIALDLTHPSGGLKRNIILGLQELFKKLPYYENQNKLKENFFSKIKKLKNYKFSRVQRNLPLRGQRTRTNCKTRKKKKIL